MVGLKKIVIIGASGNTGASTLQHLLKINSSIFVTIVSRTDSTATFPSSPQITVKKGSYDDEAFLHSAFEGNELAMFSLNHGAAADTQGKLIDAAAKAGVKYIVPNEYSLDGLSGGAASHPIIAGKVAARKQIRDLGMKHISPVTGPWTELSINWGPFGFDVPNRRATLYDDNGENNTSSIKQVGLAVAKVLSLPITSSENPRASLEHYANNFIYISSFCTTQANIFDAIKKATGTIDSDWKIEHSSIAEREKAAHKKLAAGDMYAAMDLIYSFYMGDGKGGNFDEKAREERKVLGLEEEDLNEVVKGAVAHA